MCLVRCRTPRFALMFFARLCETLAGVKRQLHAKAIQGGSLGIWPAISMRTAQTIYSLFLFRWSLVVSGQLALQNCNRAFITTLSISDANRASATMERNTATRVVMPYAEKAGSWEGFKEALRDKGEAANGSSRELKKLTIRVLRRTSAA